MGHAEYFATKYVDILAREIIEDNGNLHETLQKIEKEIEVRKEILLKQGNQSNDMVIDRKCHAKCHRNVNVKNKDIYNSFDPWSLKF